MGGLSSVGVAVAWCACLSERVGGAEGRGSSLGASEAGNSSRDNALLRGALKGVK